jgi:hypothetical protein
LGWSNMSCSKGPSENKLNELVPQVPSWMITLLTEGP